MFPLFAGQMYRELGVNVAGSVLAAVATLWLVSPFIFMKYGKRLREKGKFAKLCLEIDPQMDGNDGIGRTRAGSNS